MPFAPAGLKRVAAAAAGLLEDREPGAAPAAWPPPLSQASNAAAPRIVDVAAHHRVAEAAELGADHREGAGARRRHDQLLCSPGTASCFCESSGTQNEWMTSFAVMSSFVWRPFGIVRYP